MGGCVTEYLHVVVAAVVSRKLGAPAIGFPSQRRDAADSEHQRRKVLEYH